MTKRQRVREHRKRILQGLITTLENDLYGNGAEYIYGADHFENLIEDEQEISEIRKAGDQLLKQLRGMVDR